MEDEGEITYYETSPAAVNWSGSIYTATNSSRTSVNIPDSRVWRCNLLKNFTKFCSKIIESNKNHLIHDIINNSSLLSEDNYQSLGFIFSELTINNDQLNISINTCFTVTSSLILMLAISSIISYIVTILLLVVIATVFTTIKIKQYTARASYNKIQLYLNETETLLSVIIKVLRTIQERQIIYHGYTKPYASSTNNSTNTVYQCLPLRQRLLSICTVGIDTIRDITYTLIEKYPLNIELDNKHSYLVYRVDLSDTDQNLSLESLKSRCNLLSVLHSEMLYRFVLVLGSHLIAQEETVKHNISLEKAAGIIAPLFDFVTQSIHQLNWSLNYDNTYIINTTRSDRTVSNKSEVSIVEMSIHCADLHTYTALLKLRELDISNITVEEIEAIISNINATKHHLQEVLKELHPSTTPIQDTRNNEEIITEEKILRHDNEQMNREEDSDDDEKIYEAYVSSADQITELLEDKETATNEEWKELSKTILQELQNVLSVRRLHREKRKTKRTTIAVSMETDLNSPAAETNESCDSHMSQVRHPYMEAGMFLAKAVAAAANKTHREDIFEHSDDDNN